MLRNRFFFVLVLVTLATGSIAFAGGAGAAPVRDGKEWRQLYETTGLTAAQVASVCPRDGATPCTGSVGGRDLNGWVWATDAQVLDLMINYAPDLATAQPPILGGPGYLVNAASFLNDFRWTYSFALTYNATESAQGWTASTDAAGAPSYGLASFTYPFFNGSIGLTSIADAASPYRGVFMWRPSGFDHTAPVVTPSVSGTLGSNGWYVSDIGITWSVSDAESPIRSTSGCDPTSVGADTASATFACTATSAGLGGPTTASTTVKRDATAPTIVCAPPPTFDLGQFPAYVTATVTDATSGVVATTTSGLASTNTAGSFSAVVAATDRAGNQTTRSCPYLVGVPACRGARPTIIGTAGNDVIKGTAGRDVIIGLGGADTITSLGGDDVVCGGDGPDTIEAGDGKDLVDGGASNDNISGGGGNDDLDGGLGTDSIRGDGGTDRCTSGETRMSSCEVLY